MTEHKFTDEKVIKSLKVCLEGDNCKECYINPHHGNYGYCTSLALKAALDLINRQKAEIGRLEKDGEEARYKLECLLCHSTGGRLSKSTYELWVMETAVNDYINETYYEAKAEAIKEFADRLCEGRVSNDPVVIAVNAELKMTEEKE